MPVCWDDSPPAEPGRAGPGTRRQPTGPARHGPSADPVRTRSGAARGPRQKARRLRAGPLSRRRPVTQSTRRGRAEPPPCSGPARGVPGGGGGGEGGGVGAFMRMPPSKAPRYDAKEPEKPYLHPARTHARAHRTPAVGASDATLPPVGPSPRRRDRGPGPAEGGRGRAAANEGAVTWRRRVMGESRRTRRGGPRAAEGAAARWATGPKGGPAESV